MSKRSKDRKQRRPTRDSPRLAESRAAEMLMVGWGVTLLTTLICEVAAALLYLYAGFRPVSPQVSMLTGMFHFAALVMGLGAMALIPILIKIRHVPPPQPIIGMALIIGGLPLVGLLVQLVV